MIYEIYENPSYKYTIPEVPRAVCSSIKQ